MKQKDVPRQVASATEAKNSSKAGNTGATSAKIVGPITTATTIGL